MSVKADADVIHVPTDQPTIQQAINNATDGDTIFVHNGTYHEHVVVNKSLCLLGENKDLTIIDGDKIGSVISITASNVSIKNFTIKNSGMDVEYYDSGILVDSRLADSNNNHISHNTIINNYHGVGLLYSSDNVISSNTITNNSDGTKLWYSSDNVISSNTITDNFDGIGLLYSSDNVISSNTITDNFDGIGLLYSSDNVISSNTITDNHRGVILVYSDNDVFFHNNFVSNTQQTESINSINVWDNGYPSGGNFWSDYNGADLYNGPYQNETGKDGIGDSPHVLLENNRDNYPLMGMLSDFNITLERVTYYVTVISNSTISDFRFTTGTETGNRIIHFNATGKEGTIGFSRIGIPIGLMNYPFIVLIDAEEVHPSPLLVSNETYNLLYFTYVHNKHTVTIISSKTLHLYYELHDKYNKLQIDLYNLNTTYYDILNSYSILSSNYSQLQQSHHELQTDLYKLQIDLYNLNTTYYDILNSYSILSSNYSQLQQSHHELNNSYQKHLSDYSQNASNIRNLAYVFAVTTAVLIITITYLSKHAHTGKTKIFEDGK